ncbi:hypothetical protein [Gorillibacterium sp. sgz5001074]|uniref:hypothetical protein n=1 Tax=Gorillibacterium sp. sgz5001074 TaxID=3446695 RepID=UPI003F67EB15
MILRETDKLRSFQVEPREPFERLGKAMLYAPDALFVYDRTIYLMEVQLSRLSRKQWAQKWRVANLYFNEGHYRAAGWQRWRKQGGEFIKPHFVVVCPQDVGLVGEGFDVQGRVLRVVHSVEEIRG